jgi:hypothetical protein
MVTIPSKLLIHREPLAAGSMPRQAALVIDAVDATFTSSGAEGRDIRNTIARSIHSDAEILHFLAQLAMQGSVIATQTLSNTNGHCRNVTNPFSVATCMSQTKCLFPDLARLKVKQGRVITVILSKKCPWMAWGATL